MCAKAHKKITFQIFTKFLNPKDLELSNAKPLKTVKKSLIFDVCKTESFACRKTFFC